MSRDSTYGWTDAIRDISAQGVMPARPLCFGLRERNYHVMGMPCSDCDAHIYTSCPCARLELRNWASPEARTPALLRSYIREAHELREENANLRDEIWVRDLVSSSGPFCNRELVAENKDLRGRIATLEAALKRQVDNVERWMATGVPADAAESRSIYEQMVSALRQNQPRCPDCGQRIDAEECGCGSVNAVAIQTEDDYETALVRAEDLWGAKAGTPDGDELDALLDGFATYESVHHRVPEPDVGTLRDRIAVLEAENAKLRASGIEALRRAEAAENMRDQWNANHDEMVRRLRLFTQRPDLPVDRIVAYKELVCLQRQNSLLCETMREAAYKAALVLHLDDKDGYHSTLLNIIELLDPKQGKELKHGTWKPEE